MYRKTLWERLEIYPNDIYEVLSMTQIGGVYSFQIEDKITGSTFPVTTLNDLINHDKLLFSFFHYTVLEILSFLGIVCTSENEKTVTFTSRKGVSETFDYAHKNPLNDTTILEALETLLVDSTKILSYPNTIEGFSSWLDDLGFNYSETYKEYEEQLEKKLKHTTPYHEFVAPITQAVTTWKEERDSAYRVMIFFGDDLETLLQELQKKY